MTPILRYIPRPLREAIIFAMIRDSGRSWWQARYKDDRILSEWDTLTEGILLPIGPDKSSRWEDISKDNMIGLRLLCPNGKAGELEAPVGHKFFQLKAGRVFIGASTGRICDAHIIGVVKDDSGSCFCRAWETREARLIEFYDNILNMRYRHIGQLALNIQGIR